MKKSVYITIAIVVISIVIYLAYKPQVKITNYPSLGTDITEFYHKKQIARVGEIPGYRIDLRLAEKQAEST